MLAAWVIFPLVLTLLCVGLGLLVEVLAGRRVPGALLPLLGLATLTVVGLATTASESTASWTTAVAAILGLAGFALTGRRLPQLKPERGALIVAVAVFLVFGAPVILSGEPTFAGYIKLDDTATWFALTDRLMEHGRSLDGLAPSSYEATLSFNLAGWYPIGAFIPLGTGAKLANQELAWVFQPYLSLLAAYSALALWQLAARIQARGLAVFIASQAALLFAYAMWGGIKELVSVALIALVAALMPIVLERERQSLRGLLPLGIAAAAMVGVLSFGAGPWLVGLFGAAAVLVLQRLGLERLLRTAGLLLIWLVPLIVIGLLGHPVFPDSNALLSDSSDLGNLAAPISPLQALGIWPAADFRLDREASLLSGLLIALALLAAVGGAWRALRDRDQALLVTLGGVAIGGGLIVVFGSAWVNAKAFAVIAPFALLFAFAGLSALSRLGFRSVATIAAVLLAGGVIWSNVLGYGGVSLAPRAQLSELEQIGKRYADVEPSLMTEYQPYGVRHFLRDMAPEGASELRRRTVALADGSSLEKGESADVDRFALSELQFYRALVLRRSPANSRPPQPYDLSWKGDYYELWEKQMGQPEPIGHLPLGTAIDPASVPDCGEVLSLAAEAGPEGSLIAAGAVAQPLAFEVGEVQRSGALEASAAGSSYLEPRGAGEFEVTAEIPEAGRYEVWLGGSLRPSYDLEVDGEEVDTGRQQLNTAGNYIPLGSVELEPGSHTFKVSIGSADLHPGSAGSDGPVGPLVIQRTSSSPPRLTSVPASAARSLCGQPWDWIEAMAAS